MFSFSMKMGYDAVLQEGRFRKDCLPIGTLQTREEGKRDKMVSGYLKPLTAKIPSFEQGPLRETAVIS